MSEQQDDEETNRQRRRCAALEQANEVIENMTNNLDGFNLLGVIANPRNTPLMSSYHGTHTRQPSQQDLSSIEWTVSQVTEGMESLNLYLEDWSRQILEEHDYNNSGEEIPESQLTQLPPQLQIDTQSIQNWLQQSGPLAQSFQQRQELVQVEQHDDDDSMELPQLDDVFWNPNFDLTDPQTFGQLLLLQPPSNSSSTEWNPSSNENGDASTSIPLEEWFPLLPPDAFGTSLDQVELALLSSVRQRSDAFFEESLRMSQLQEWILELIEQVSELQHTNTTLNQDLVQPLSDIPQLDTQKSNLQQLHLVMSQAQELILVKSSIAGYLSAQDAPSAIQQVQYARRLLQDGNGLNRLTAFSAIADQLEQYEQLIVTNLRDELMELFLEWNTPNSDTLARVDELVQNLQSCQALETTRTAYQSRLESVIRLTCRTIVGEFGTSHVSDLSQQDQFEPCLTMILEQLSNLVSSAARVNDFCQEHGYFVLQQNEQPMARVVLAAAELSSKSVAELLRLRKEAHSLVSLEEMKRIWDTCHAFCTFLETTTSGQCKATALTSTLLAQAKAFCERQHESNMSALVAALDSERWVQCAVSVERQEALTRLCAGRTVIPSPTNKQQRENSTTQVEKQPQAQVEGIRYKVVWSCLLLIEMVLNDIAAASHFRSLASNLVAKIAELLRLFNSRTTHLVLGAGAIHSAARLKSINAKHLSLVTQCLGIILALLPHVRAALMAQMPPKQHTLLSALDQIKKEYADHNEKVLNKFVTIIGGIVEHGLAPKIGGTDFDARAQANQPDGSITCCVFLEGVSTNTRKMHQVLSSLLPPDHLQDVFTRIFAFVDQKVPVLFMAACEEDTETISPRKESTPAKAKSSTTTTFVFPKTDAGKKQLLLEVETMTKNLNGLDGVQPWEFTAITVFERRLEYKLHAVADESSFDTEKPSAEADSEAESVITNETGITTEPGDAEENGTLDSPGRDKGSKKAFDKGDEKSSMEEEPAENGLSEHAAEGGTVQAPNAAESESAQVEQQGETDEPALSDENRSSDDNAATDYPSEITTL